MEVLLSLVFFFFLGGGGGGWRGGSGNEGIFLWVSEVIAHTSAPPPLHVVTEE